MSSTIVFDQGFGDSRQASRWWRDTDGALATHVREDELIRIVWDLTDYLASGETVSSAARDSDGPTISAESVSSPQVIWTQTGYGDVEVTATLSTGRIRQTVFRAIPSDSQPRDYGR